MYASAGRVRAKHARTDPPTRIRTFYCPLIAYMILPSRHILFTVTHSRHRISSRAPCHPHNAHRVILATKNDKQMLISLPYLYVVRSMRLVGICAFAGDDWPSCRQSDSCTTLVDWIGKCLDSRYEAVHDGLIFIDCLLIVVSKHSWRRLRRRGQGQQREPELAGVAVHELPDDAARVAQ
jgi:hypothetical protein